MTKVLYLVGIVFMLGAVMESGVSFIHDTAEYLRMSLAGAFSFVQTGAVPPVIHGFAIGAHDWVLKKIENNER